MSIFFKNQIINNLFKKDIQKIKSLSDSIILIFLSIQIFSTGISIALSSISFGIWIGIWILQFIFFQEAREELHNVKRIKTAIILLLFYIMSDAISRIFAVIPDGALIYMKRFLLFSIIPVSIIKINSDKILKYFILSILFFTALISLIEIIKFIIIYFNNTPENFSESRIDYFNYPLTSGEIKLMIFLSFFPLLFTKSESIIPKNILIITIIPILISMYLTQSRNVFIALAFCLILSAILLRKKSLIVLLSAVVLLFILSPSKYTYRIASIIDINHPSNKSRLIMWETGLKMFKDRPLFGTGDNEITEVYKRYKIPEFHGEGSHLHSNYLMILVTNGIIGMIFYLLFFIIIIANQINIYNTSQGGVNKMLTLGSILTMISLHITGIFEWTFGDWEVLTVFLFLISIPYIINNLEKQNIKYG